MDLLVSPHVETYYLVQYVPVVVLFSTFLILHVTIAIITVIRKSWNKPVPAAWRAIIDVTLIGGLKSETAENGRNGISCLGTQSLQDMFEVWEYLWCHYGNLYLSLSG